MVDSIGYSAFLRNAIYRPTRFTSLTVLTRVRLITISLKGHYIKIRPKYSYPNWACNTKDVESNFADRDYLGYINLF